MKTRLEKSRMHVRLADQKTDVCSLMGVSPAEVWTRPHLGKRERSLVTLAALISLGRTDELDQQIHQALANGATREELRELVTHLALCIGWENASAALRIAKTCGC